MLVHHLFVVVVDELLLVNYDAGDNLLMFFLCQVWVIGHLLLVLLGTWQYSADTWHDDVRKNDRL